MHESGVPVLFIRMAIWVSDHFGYQYEVYVVDYQEGAMARNLKDKDNIQLCAVEDYLEGDLEIDDDSIFIMQALVPYYWPENIKFSPKAKLIYWALHPKNLVPSLLPFPLIRQYPFQYQSVYSTCSIFYKDFLHRIGELINAMNKHGAIAFMDKTNFLETQRHIPLEPGMVPFYLPVPAEDYDGTLKKESNSGTINACWLGRLEDEKMPILTYSLKRVAQYALQYKQKINFIILGYGYGAEIADSLDLDNEYFKKTKSHSIKFTEINEFLLKNVDVMFAMGTSALESAKLGIPTVLVDLSYNNIKGEYAFSFINSREGYDLGHPITAADCKEGNDSLCVIFNAILNRYEIVSKQSRDYFVMNHSMKRVGENFVKMISQSTFYFDMIDPLVIQKPFLLQIYNKLRNFNR
jgi:hypothetical protein